MTPEARAELESRADRARRRGELAEALALYEQIAKEHPADGGIAQKLALLRENLQPLELQHPKANFVAEPAPAKATSPEQEGERLYAQGDYASAAAAYRRALRERPDNELVKERLFELYRLAQSGASPAAEAPAPGLPEDPEARLQALLDRIASRKRPAPV